MDNSGNQTSGQASQARMPVTGQFRSWVGRWLQPTGHRVPILALFILALIGVVRILVYETGGTGYASLHLMYLPIILAAAGFGVCGGVLSALVGGIALGPGMPMQVAGNLPQTPSNWIFRIGFFLLVGVFCGLISNFLNGQIKRLQVIHERLVKAHEEVKQAQLILIQTAKLESIGRLAAGVAHEVKNPLAVIQLGVDYLGRAAKANANPDAMETIQEMADAVRRADTVIKGLLNFSRSEQLVPVPADLNSVIEESLVLVRHELTKHTIMLDKSLAESCPEIELDRNKVKQVFINVFMNAVQAMGDNGKLSVKTFTQPASAESAGQGLSGETAVVQIEDTGSGIPEDKQDKLFEPFFTTKPVGTGTGLGLSVSRKIIELHRGTIRIANRADKIRGVAVTITFPVPKKS